jgi:hypothetical protein
MDFSAQLNRLTTEILEVFGETVRYTPDAGESCDLRAVLTSGIQVSSEFPGFYMKVTAFERDFIGSPRRNDRIEVRGRLYRVVEVNALADASVELTLCATEH